MTRSVLRTAASTAALALLPTILAAQAPERIEVSGDRVAVFNLAGSATVAAGTGSAVVVEVQRRGSAGARLAIQQGPIGDRQTLRVVYPDDDILFRTDEWNGRTEMRVRDDGTFGGSDDRHGSSHRVTIRSDGDGLDAHADLRILVPRGQHVEVYLGIGPITATNVNGDLYLDGSAGAVTTEGTTGHLGVDVGSGTVRVTRHTGNGSIDTGSGNVTVSGAHGDDWSIDTGSGSVSLTDVGAPSLRIDTGSGSVDGTGVQADDLSVDTGSGDVEVALTKAPGRLSVDTGSGDVTFTIPPGLDAEVSLETSSGSITMDFPMQVKHWERDEVRGVVGTGHGSVSIETGSGDITVRKR